MAEEPTDWIWLWQLRDFFGDSIRRQDRNIKLAVHAFRQIHLRSFGVEPAHEIMALQHSRLYTRKRRDVVLSWRKRDETVATVLIRNNAPDAATQITANRKSTFGNRDRLKRRRVRPEGLPRV